MPSRKTAYPILLGLVSACAAAQAGPVAPASRELVPLPVPRPSTGRDQIPGPDLGTDKPEAPKRTMVIRPYGSLLEQEARKNGLPPEIADAVTAIESGYDPGALGGVGEIGLMQVRPSTAAMLGFTGNETDLAKPEVNIRYGVTYLAQAWRLANGDLCRALMKYRAGHGEEFMSPLSVQYCGRARAHLASIGSPLAEGVTAPFVYDPAVPKARAARRGPRFRTAAVSAAFWATHEARVKAISRRIEAKWRRIASR